MRDARLITIFLYDPSSADELLRGIRDYAHPGRGWAFSFVPAHEMQISLLADWPQDGIISLCRERDTVRGLAGLGIPMVNMASGVADMGVPSVIPDDVAVGRMAAEHFLARGFRHFGYYGSLGRAYTIGRETGFRDRLARAGLTCSVLYEDEYREGVTTWRVNDEKLCAWLEGLPKPLAIFTHRDRASLFVAQACRRLGLSVPEQVAILGVDNQEGACALATPPLSSIHMPARQAGYQAALLLDHLMAGQPAPSAPRLLPPVTVVTRKSTDVLAVSDPILLEALRFIHAHAAEPIGVEDLLRIVPLSRRPLELRFRREIGRSPMAEIRRVRCELAKRLLMARDTSIAQIAVACGLQTHPNLCRVFREEVGCSPAEFRRRFQAG